MVYRPQFGIAFDLDPALLRAAISPGLDGAVARGMLKARAVEVAGALPEQLRRAAAEVERSVKAAANPVPADG